MCHHCVHNLVYPLVPCFGANCYMFNAHHDINTSYGFCSENVNKLLDVQKILWYIIFIIVVNCIPLLIYWHTEANENTEDAEWITLFGIDKSNYELYPYIGRLCYHLAQDNRRLFIIIRAACFYILWLIFHIWWSAIENFAEYPSEYYQRLDILHGNNGNDGNLITSERRLLAGIITTWNVLYLVCFLIATLGNFVLVYVLGDPSLWVRNKRFLCMEDITKNKVDITDGPDIFVCRRTMLFRPEFWSELRDCIDVGDKCNDEGNKCCGKTCECKCLKNACKFFISHLSFIPVAIIAFFACILPLFDVILHTPWLLFKDSRNLKIGILLVFIYVFSFAIYYIFHYVLVISLIFSYTITGLMKNWNFLLPIIVLIIIVVSHWIRLVYGAFKPMHRLQVIIFNQCKSMQSPPKIIKEDDKVKGKYYIKRSFIEKCYKCPLLLKPSEYKNYTIFSIIQFLGLVLIVIATGSSFYTLNSDTSLGKAVMALSLTFVPQVVNSLMTPWHDDVTSAVRDAKIKEKINEEINKVTVNVKKFDLRLHV